MDVFSFGVILYELMTGMIVFSRVAVATNADACAQSMLEYAQLVGFGLCFGGRVRCWVGV